MTDGAFKAMGPGVRRPEQALQRAMIEYLDAVLVPPAFSFAIPNGGWRSPVEAAILKGQGVRPGIPDVAIVSEGRVYFLEVKSPTGRSSQAQRAMHERLIAAGGWIAVVRSLEEVEGCLYAWKIPMRGNLGTVRR